MSNESPTPPCEHADATWAHCQHCPGQIVVNNANGTKDYVCPGGLKVVEALRSTLALPVMTSEPEAPQQ